MFALYQIAFAPIRKPYWIGLLFTHEKGDFGAISVTERSFPAPISKWRVTYRIGVHTIPHGLSVDTNSIRYSVNMA